MMLRLALEAMGTRFELVLDGEDEFSLRAAGEAAIQEIREQHDRLSIFSTGSLLSRVNERAFAAPVGVDPDLLDLLALCRRLWKASDGAFDPAVGRIMTRLGFRRPGEGTATPRDNADVLPSFAAVLINEARGTVRFTSAAVALDLGGVAKGWALDRAVEILRDAGVTGALIHGGTSTAVAIGAPPGSEGWPIEIASHRDEVPPLLCMLRDTALSVSSPLGRTVEHGGRSVGHVVDPRTGGPASGTLVTAAVCTSAAEADAWSTALVVSGGRSATMPAGLAHAVLPEEGPHWTIAPDASQVFTIRDRADGQGDQPHGG